jgi:hypothetical protein
MNHLMYIVLDSCRYDTYLAARTPNLDRLGQVERRYSYASWTSPSHYVYLMGMIPHQNPPLILASEIYKEDFKAWGTRLGVPHLEFRDFVPELSLPRQLQKLGYTTVGRVSLPVLNEYTTFSQYFDDYKLMENHNDFAGMIREIHFHGPKPFFYLLNLGETHYPYMLDKSQAPILHGVHGVLKNLGAEQESPQAFFDQEQMARFRQQQIRALEYLDGLLGDLYRKCPANTYFIITADHGELFGEDGFFGHGPIFHEKVFEVPFVEGLLPA